MNYKEKLGQIKETLALLMQEVANDDNLQSETGLRIMVSLDLAITASDYAQALTAGYRRDIDHEKARLLGFLRWLEEIE
jgi:uncharacterized protein YigA (DUF484 family)